MRDSPAIAPWREPLVDAQPVHGAVCFPSPEDAAASRQRNDQGQADFVSISHLDLHRATESPQFFQDKDRASHFGSAQGGCAGKDARRGGWRWVRPTRGWRGSWQDH